jgi:hypothetical protein
MSYIKINTKTLEVDLVPKKPIRGVFIPAKLKRRGSTYRSRLQYLLYFKVLYPLVEECDRKKGLKVNYCLHEPDPWLQALGALMIEGIIQGAAWDMIKAACQAALRKLQNENLAPEHTKNHKSKTTLGFSWTEFSEDGKPLREFFLGVKREIESLTETEQRAITRKSKKPLRKATKVKKQSRFERSDGELGGQGKV